MAASYDNLAAAIDPFLLRHSFSDYFWPTLSDNETLSMSKSIFDDHHHSNHQLLLPLQYHQTDHHHHKQQMYQNQNQSLSPFSSSDLDQQINGPNNPASGSTTPKRRSTTPLNAAGASKPRITKRKSRATKKNQTTFITTDPANFRQMVQQVTGIRFGTNSSSTTSSSSLLPPSLSHLIKPEIHRPVGRLYNACLPTLDTSSFLLNRSGQSLIGGGGVAATQSSAIGASEAGFASFPTLESWKVM